MNAVKNSIIETYRRRIAIATLHRMKRKTGGYCLEVMSHETYNREKDK